MDRLAEGQTKMLAIWLMINCPMGTALENCPAKDIRENIRDLPVTDRIKKVNEMNFDQLAQIVNNHKQCLIKRKKPWWRIFG